MQTDSDSGYHDFKDGNHVVLDILAPKTDGTAYAPPGTAKPSITKMGVTAMKTAPAQPAPASPQDQLMPPPADQETPMDSIMKQLFGR